MVMPHSIRSKGYWSAEFFCFEDRSCPTLAEIIFKGSGANARIWQKNEKGSDTNLRRIWKAAAPSLRNKFFKGSCPSAELGRQSKNLPFFPLFCTRKCQYLSYIPILAPYLKFQYYKAKSIEKTPLENFKTENSNENFMKRLKYLVSSRKLCTFCYKMGETFEIKFLSWENAGKKFRAVMVTNNHYRLSNNEFGWD